MDAGFAVSQEVGMRVSARKQRAGFCRCEVLETRQLLAGQVTASVVNGDLVLIGDGEPNQITVEQSGLAEGSVRVTAYRTSLNGGIYPLVFTGVTGGIRATLFDGDDRLNVQDLTLAGGLEVQGGGGGDSLLLINARLGGGLSTQMAAGGDTVQLYDSTIGEAVTIYTGRGPDVVNVDGCSFAGAVHIETRWGRDSLAASNNTAPEGLVLDAGRGINQTVLDGTARQSFDFRNGMQGWETGFADYFTSGGIDPATYFQIQAGLRPLPAELGIEGTGLYLSGLNRSDDLFMFLKRQLGPEQGLIPGWTYDLTYSVVFATRVPAGARGIGGPPGEAVSVKAGGSLVEPNPVYAGYNHWRLNIDAGNQANSGSEAIVIGDLTNGQNWEEPDPWHYGLVRRSATGTARVTVGPNGELWLFVGTDSGYEGTTELYYVSIDVVLTPVMVLG